MGGSVDCCKDFKGWVVGRSSMFGGGIGSEWAGSMAAYLYQ